MRSLLPLEKLPTQCVATDASKVLPPVFLRGWLIDESKFRQDAANRGIVRTSETYIYPDDWDKHRDPSTIQHVVYFDAVSTFNAYASTVIKKQLGVLLPVCGYLRYVWGSKVADDVEQNPVAIIALYDNYHIYSKPSKENIERIRVVFGFEGEPQWFPEASELYWRYASTY